jgi:DNA-binding transcriptional LysR family regulator
MLSFRLAEGRMALADEISDLRLFTRVVAAGSLSEAARRTVSSLPAVSRRLAALEERLGVRLIDRGPRRFTLTDEGALFHERAVAILREIDNAEAEASAHAKQPRGHVRVGTHLEIGRRRIAPLIGEFTSLYPGITAELILTDSRLQIVEDEIDVGLQADLPSDGNIVSRVVLSGHRVVCASPEYLAKHPPLNQPADLRKHDCIRWMRGRHVVDQWAFKEEGHITQVQIHGSLFTNNAEVVHDWAVAGRAVGLKVLWDIQDDLRSGRLTRLLEPFECDEVKLYATYATRTHLPPRVRLFIDFIVSALQKIYA